MTSIALRSICTVAHMNSTQSLAAGTLIALI